VVGGLSNVVRNQLTFAGLPETAIYTGSAVSGLLGYQYAIGHSVFLTGRANVLYYDFIANSARPQSARVAYGGSLTLGISTLLGPIDISLMYSGVSKKVLPYFNIGFPFGYR
jgi:NTE family protein